MKPKLTFACTHSEQWNNVCANFVGNKCPKKIFFCRRLDDGKCPGLGNAIKPKMSFSSAGNRKMDAIQHAKLFLVDTTSSSTSASQTFLPATIDLSCLISNEATALSRAEMIFGRNPSTILPRTLPFYTTLSPNPSTVYACSKVLNPNLVFIGPKVSFKRALKIIFALFAGSSDFFK